MEDEIIGVSKSVFSSLVESYLSGNYRLFLTVEEMTEKKTFSCKEKGCGKPFDAYPPDDTHLIASVEKSEGAIERTYTCPASHENAVYWTERSRHTFVASAR